MSVQILNEAPPLQVTTTTTTTASDDVSTFPLKFPHNFNFDFSLVEVVLGPNAGIWHLAQIIELTLPSDFPDVDGGVGSLKISFPNTKWRPLEVSPLRTRLPSRPTSNEDNSPPSDGHSGTRSPMEPSRTVPSVGEILEVYIPESQDEPPYWVMSRVSQISSDSSMLVAFVDSSGQPQEIIVALIETRYPSKSPPLSLLSVQRRRVPLPPFLTQQPWNAADVDEDDEIVEAPPAGDEPWIDTPEAVALFRRLRKTCAILQLSLLRTRSPIEIELVGDHSECIRAEGILSQEFQQLKSVLEFHERRGRRLKLLEERKQRYSGTGLLEFEADDAMIGLIIGKQGENISRVAKTHKVEIRVLPDDSGVRRIRIYGDSVEAATRARDELDYSFVDHPVDGHLMAWAVAKRGSNLRELAQRTGLHSAWLNEASATVVLCGLKVSVVAAVSTLRRVQAEGPGALLASIDRFLPSRPHIARQPAGRGRGRRPEGGGKSSERGNRWRWDDRQQVSAWGR